ncbi:MAG TPA: Uma2 family endonuclease [Pyrinomonadaceae bacterium]|jgi:Uma2 family endonuclease
MGTPKKLSYITAAEYLDGEKLSEVRHEYIDGEVYAMAGATIRHYRLVKQIGNMIDRQLQSTDCEVFIVDMKTKANEYIYYYPDVVVTCENLNDEQDYISQPKLIIEVLSPSTASKDKREKLVAYKLINSLHEYAIVWQDEMRVELHRRQNDGWLTFFYTQPEEKIELASINLQTSVTEIYRSIKFEQ